MAERRHLHKLVAIFSHCFPRLLDSRRQPFWIFKIFPFIIRQVRNVEGVEFVKFTPTVAHAIKQGLRFVFAKRTVVVKHHDAIFCVLRIVKLEPGDVPGLPDVVVRGIFFLGFIMVHLG